MVADMPSTPDYASREAQNDQENNLMPGQPAAPPLLTPTCTMWSQLWLPTSGGGFIASGWDGGNGDFPGSYVQQGQGGANYAGASIPEISGVPQPLFLTSSSSGSVTLAWNLGQQPFVGKVPTGFIPGWPGADGLSPGFGVTNKWDYFDASTIQGDAAIAPTGTVFTTTADGPGLIQSHTGYYFGCFYVEVTFANNTIFTSKPGGGIARLGVSLDDWLSGGEYSNSDTNGGAQYNGGYLGNGFAGSLWANGNEIISGLPENVTGTVLGLAISIAPDPFPHVRQPVTAVSLVCVPCQPLVTDPSKWPNHFG